jgi:hypothetical protein
MNPNAAVILHETKKLMPSAKKATLITQNHRHRDTILSNHNPKDFQNDERQETGNKNAKTSD